MEINFKFNVGDLITTRAHRRGIENVHVDRYPTHVSLILTVTSRHSDECTSGTQISYLCRVEHVGHNPSISQTTNMFHEVELTDDLSSIEPEKKEPTQ